MRRREQGGSEHLAARGRRLHRDTSAGRAVAVASGWLLASMVGMYQHQLRDDPFDTLSGGHCGEQPRVTGGGASSSSPSAVHDPLSAEVHGGGQPRQRVEALADGRSMLRGGGSGIVGAAGGDLGVLVRWMRELAADPVGPLPAPSEHRVRKRHVLAWRRARYLRLEDVADAEELPSFSKVSSLERKTLVFC